MDCLLAAPSVTATGHVIGVDMVAEMLTKAEANARLASVDNVQFRYGLAEELPVPDDSIDVLIANGVIKLEVSSYVEVGNMLAGGDGNDTILAVGPKNKVTGGNITDFENLTSWPLSLVPSCSHR